MYQQIILQENDETDNSSESSYSSTDSGIDDDSRSLTSKKKELDLKNKPERKKSTMKGSGKRTGRSNSPSKKLAKKGSKKSKSPAKKKNKGRSNSPKRIIDTIQSRRSPGVISIEKSADEIKPSELIANVKDEIITQSTPLRPSEISVGRAFTKRTARLSKNNNLKFQLEEQKLQNLEKQKLDAEAKRINILKARIALAKERVRWFKELGIGKIFIVIYNATIIIIISYQ